MSKRSVDIKCPGCNFKNKVNFKKPDIFNPTVDTFECEKCEAIIQFQIKKVPCDNVKVTVSAGVFKSSDTLRLLMMEKQK